MILKSQGILATKTFERWLECDKAKLERLKNEWMIVELNGEA